MPHVFEKLYRAPYSMPNGLQVVNEGLWLVDQMTDRLALVSMDPPGDPDYCVFTLIRDLPSGSSNTSGLSYGGGSLWLAANGSGRGLWRPERPTDAGDGQGEILQVDPDTGATQNRYLVPGGGGTHGVEYDAYEEGILWVTTLHQGTLSKLRIADWSVRHTLPLPYRAAHGVVRVENGVWVAFKPEWCIIKMDLEDGSELDRIVVPKHLPEIHGLARYGDDLLYCDATSGWIVRIHMGGEL